MSKSRVLTFESAGSETTSVSKSVASSVWASSSRKRRDTRNNLIMVRIRNALSAGHIKNAVSASVVTSTTKSNRELDFCMYCFPIHRSFNPTSKTISTQKMIWIALTKMGTQGCVE